MEENELGEEGIVPVNPIEEKDRQIAELEKSVEESKSQEIKLNQLKEALSKSKAELKTVKSSHDLSLQKLAFTQKATEQRLLDSISNPEGFHADPGLIGVYSATLDEEEFEFSDSEESTEDSGRSRKDVFLKSIEDKIDPKNPEHKERFLEIKNQILEKVKVTKVSRVRTRSVSSVTSRGSKRELSSESLSKTSGRSPARARTTGIPKIVQ